MTVLEINGKRVEVDDGFKNLSPEQQEATVQEIARSMGLGQTGGNDLLRPIGLINTGIAGVFDGMAGPLNRGVNAALGTNLSETPTADAFGMTGVATRQPETMGERALVGAGGAAGMLVPATGVMRAAQGGAGLMAGAGRTLSAPFINAPKATIAAEMAAGAGASALGDMSDEYTDGNPLARGAAEVLGGGIAGLGTAALGSGVRAATNVAPVVMAARGVRAAVAPFTGRGAQIIAEDSVRRMAADPDRAADRLLLEDNVGNLTPAQQTGEPGLMALERGFAERDPRLAEGLTQRVGQSRQELDASAREGAQGRTSRDTRDFFKERIERHTKFLDALVNRAQTRADDAVRDIEPRARPMALSEQVRGEIDKAFEIARSEETRKWERVPREVEIPTTQARAALQRSLTETTDVSQDRIPPKARRFLGDDEGAFGETVTMDRLHRLYSELRFEAREARGRTIPDTFSARQSDNVADAILRDIEAAEGVGGRAAELLADARAYSSEMNRTFGQDTIGKLVAVQRSGADRVPEGLTLDASVGAMGDRGALAVDDIRRATGSASDPALTDYMRNQFADSAIRNDAVDLSRAETFVRNNRELVDRFPDGFQPAMDRAISTARIAANRGSRVENVLKVLGDRNAPGQVGFVNARAGQEVAKAIFDAENPAAAARAIARAAQRDQSGDAYLGLKGGLVDEVIRRATSGSSLKGDSLVSVLDNPEMRKVLTEILPPQERAALRVMATQLRKLDTWEGVGPEDVANAPNMMVSTFLQMQAAKAGRALGTGTIQAPGIMVNRTRSLLNRLSVDKADALIHEALRDPKLLAALLTGPGSRRAQIQKAEEALTTWATGVLGAEAANPGDQGDP